jgi:putative ABC transport system permease protein
MSHADIVQALRRLRHQPIFALGVIAVLALAIGANTAMFTLVDAILLKPLPLRDPDRLVTFTIVRPGNARQPLSLADLADFESDARTLGGIAAVFGWSANLTGAGDAERLQGMRVSPDYFELTGTSVALGRPLTADDEYRAVVLLTHGVWLRRFGGAPEAVGRQVQLNGEAFDIVGVLRPDFVSLVRDAEVVVPFSPASDPRRANRAQGFLRVVARARPGATMEQIADDLDAIVRRLRAAYPDAHGTDTGALVRPLHEEISGRAAPMLRMLSAAVVVVLLVACANLANLFMVHAASRRRELALRTALGASRRRVVFQLLAEAAILAVAGGAAGLAVAGTLVQTLIAIGPRDLPRVAEVGLDLRVAVVTLAVSLAASVMVGLLPALQASRGDLRESLQGADRTVARAGGRARAWLVFAEVALSTVLLVTAALLVRSFQQVQSVDPGFRPSHALSVRLSLPRGRYANRAAIQRFFEQVHPRIASLPGIRSVAAANVVPMNGYLATTSFQVEGDVERDLPETHYRMVSPEYFDALGIPVRQGRTFTSADRSETQPVVIVSETFARMFLARSDALGARLRLDDGGKTPRTVHVIGVVGDVKHFGPERESPLEVYVPIPQVPEPTTIWLANNMYWVVRTEGEPLAVANAVRREIAAVDPNVPASFVRSMGDWVEASVAARRFNLQLLAAFAVAALLLAAAGVYAVSASAVAARTRELGIRAALGASRLAIVRLVLRGALVPVVAGVAAGAAAALVSGRAISGLLFGVTPRDPASLGLVCATLMAAALVASYVPARRAGRVDPLEALRE